MTQRKILIIGGPKCGKTTKAIEISNELGIAVQHFDSYIHDYHWSDLSAKICEWFDEPGPWIKEGVVGVRALRKWLYSHPNQLPDFEIVVLNTPHVVLTNSQELMHETHTNILQHCLDEIEDRQILKEMKNTHYNE